MTGPCLSHINVNTILKHFANTATANSNAGERGRGGGGGGGGGGGSAIALPAHLYRHSLKCAGPRSAIGRAPDS